MFVYLIRVGSCQTEPLFPPSSRCSRTISTPRPSQLLKAPSSLLSMVTVKQTLTAGSVSAMVAPLSAEVGDEAGALAVEPELGLEPGGERFVEAADELLGGGSGERACGARAAPAAWPTAPLAVSTACPPRPSRCRRPRRPHPWPCRRRHRPRPTLRRRPGRPHPSRRRTWIRRGRRLVGGRGSRAGRAGTAWRAGRTAGSRATAGPTAGTAGRAPREGPPAGSAAKAGPTEGSAATAGPMGARAYQTAGRAGRTGARARSAATAGSAGTGSSARTACSAATASSVRTAGQTAAGSRAPRGPKADRTPPTRRLRAARRPPGRPPCPGPSPSPGGSGLSTCARRRGSGGAGVRGAGAPLDCTGWPCTSPAAAWPPCWDPGRPGDPGSPQRIGTTSSAAERWTAGVTEGDSAVVIGRSPSSGVACSGAAGHQVPAESASVVDLRPARA